MAVFPVDTALTFRKSQTPTLMTFHSTSDRLTICYFKNIVSFFFFKVASLPTTFALHSLFSMLRLHQTVLHIVLSELI